MRLLCIRTKIVNEIIFDLAGWFVLTLSRLISKVTVKGHSTRSHEEIAGGRRELDRVRAFWLYGFYNRMSRF